MDTVFKTYESFASNTPGYVSSNSSGYVSSNTPGYLSSNTSGYVSSNTPGYTSSNSLTLYRDLSLSSDDSDPDSPLPTYALTPNASPEPIPEEPPVKRPKPEHRAPSSRIQRPTLSLIEAIRTKDLKIVQLYLSEIADINQLYDHMSLLHLAVEVDDIPITQELLRHGFDVNMLDFSRRTPLHSAVNMGLREMVRLLLNSGADANVHDKYGLTPLHTAVRNCNNKAVRIGDLRRDGTTFSEDDAKLWNMRNFDTHFKILEELVECHSVDINLPCTMGKTALYYAVVGVNGGYAQSLVRLLLQYDADVNVMNIKGKTALSRAMTLCRAEIIEDLLKKGADTSVLINDANARITPILWGIMRNRADIVELLLKYSTFNVNDPTLCPNHASLLHYAAEHSNVWAIRRLINAGADVRVTNAQGVTPFLICTKNNTPRDLANSKLFLEHLVVLENQRRYRLTDEELQIIYSDDHFELELHHRKMRNEMLPLKAMKIPRTNITFYDFLISSDHFASCLIQHPPIHKYCATKALVKLYPAFSRLMSDRYSAGQTRAELLYKTQAIANLRKIFFGSTHPSQNQYIISECVDQILRFLNNRDLKHLLMAYESA